MFVVLLAATIGCGLMAGLFFAFSVSVMHALRRLPPAHGMAAMQAINAAILNPVFLPVFVGTFVLCLVVLIASLARWSEPGAIYATVGAALYLAGAFLVTVAINVPMNNALAAAVPGGPDSERLWASYQSGWTAWNHVRTVASLAATVALTIALLRQPVM